MAKSRFATQRRRAIRESPLLSRMEEWAKSRAFSPAGHTAQNHFATQRKRGADAAFGGETSPPTNPNRVRVKTGRPSRRSDGKNVCCLHMPASLRKKRLGFSLRILRIRILRICRGRRPRRPGTEGDGFRRGNNILHSRKKRKTFAMPAKASFPSCLQYGIHKGRVPYAGFPRGRAP